ncbi:MAG: NAD(P)-binding domain-containing protein, partial [Deltaproteobacteria bacterium]|nr:NAD(P)-binding domain-containing protein [Deltaproteobacteria bacterium]
MASSIERVGVIGAGSWGTALANLLAEKGVPVDLWVREEEVCQQIKEERMNRVFLPDMTLDRRLNPVRTFEEALSKKELILMAVPSQFFRDVLVQIKPHLKTGMSIISATKGIENDTLMIMSQVVESVLPASLTGRFSCLAGPSFAKEVCRKHPTAITIACRDSRHAEELQQLFFTEFFRVYISRDPVGVQLCGALK